LRSEFGRLSFGWAHHVAFGHIAQAYVKICASATKFVADETQGLCNIIRQ